MNNTPPNLIIMNMDNLGYGDLGCQGSTLHRTPHIDQLAEQARADLGDSDREGANQRPAGWVENPKPQLLQP